MGALVGVVVGLVLLLALAYSALIRRGGPDPDLYRIRGIDVSHHQGPIDWDRVAETDIEFAFIKATEGRDFSDPRFSVNWEQSQAAGITRGAYHFFTFCSPGLDQARHFLAVVPPEVGALTPAVDVEFSGNCMAYRDLVGVRDELQVFLTELERAWGRKPILYLTARSKFQIATARFDDYPVWLRNVFWRLPGDASSFWSIWQHADDGEIVGIDGPVDLNVLNPEISLASLRLEQ